MPKLIVEVVADAVQYFRTLEQSSKAAQVFTTETTKMGVSARQTAEAQVTAAVKSTDALRSQVAALREVAAATEKGSKEQIAAANLAASAERRLATSMGVSATEATRLRGSAGGLERDLGRATRGVAAGTGIFSGFARSLAFASGGFLAFEGASSFIRGSVDAARDSVVTQRQLATQLAVTGKSFSAERDRIDEATAALSHLSGFNVTQLEQSLTLLLRSTGRLDRALALNATAADVARGRHISLTVAAVALGKAYDGQSQALRRLGIIIPKHLSGMEAINVVQQKFAGQAAAGATAQDRFSAELHNTEIVVGQALLPTINKALTSFSNWLDKMNRSGRTAKDAAAAVGVLKDAFHVLKDAMEALNTVTGSTKATLETLAGAFALFKGLELAARIKGTATSLGMIGTAAKNADGEVGKLQTRLSAVSGITIAAITIPIVYDVTTRILKATGGYGFLEKLGADVQKNLSFLGIGQNAETAGYVPPTERVAGGANYQARASSVLGQRVAALRAQQARAIAEQQAATTAATTATRGGISPDMRNRIFDARLQRELGHVSDQALPQQITTLEKIAGQIEARINVTKDITRKLNLEDQLRQVFDQENAAKQALQQSMIDALQFNVDKAGLTATVTDDLRALRRLQAFLEQQIQAHGKTLALEQQLLQVDQQIQQVLKQQAANRAAAAQERAARWQAVQYRALGLTAAGDQPVPGVKALRRQLDYVNEAIAGTFLDTTKERSVLAHIRTVLSGGLGAVGRDVRDKIAQILSTTQQQLKGAGGDVTRFRHASSEAILAALGPALSPEQRRRALAALSMVGAGGTVPGARSSSFALAGAGVVVNGDVHVHGVTSTKQLENELTKRSKGRAAVRRGAR